MHWKNINTTSWFNGLTCQRSFAAQFLPGYHCRLTLCFDTSRFNNLPILIDQLTFALAPIDDLSVCAHHRSWNAIVVGAARSSQRRIWIRLVSITSRARQAEMSSCSLHRQWNCLPEVERWPSTSDKGGVGRNKGGSRSLLDILARNVLTVVNAILSLIFIMVKIMFFFIEKQVWM